ncbi:MAG: pilus assembly protein [Pseudoxanthomonas suwonensis]|nr:pilus assembly protein [Pseudoxanthomonas suwonensis]
MKHNNRIIGGRRQRGQGMTEYIIIVALIAIAAIGVYTAFGKTVRGQMAVMTSELAGQNSSNRSQVTAGKTKADAQAAKQGNLSNYEESNRSP